MQSRFSWLNFLSFNVEGTIFKFLPRNVFLAPLESFSQIDHGFLEEQNEKNLLIFLGTIIIDTNIFMKGDSHNLQIF